MSNRRDWHRGSYRHAGAQCYRRGGRQRRLAEMVCGAGQAIASTLELNEVLRLILVHMKSIIGHDRGAVLLRSGTSLEIVATNGFPFEGSETRIRIPVAGSDDGIFPRIYRSQQPLAIADVSEEPDWHQVPGLPQTHAWLGVPLIRENEVIGMLSLAREGGRPFTGWEVSIATAFAGQAALALHNARLYAAERQAYDQLERLDRARSDFVAIASHELRTPLMLVASASQLMADDPNIQASPYHLNIAQLIQGGASQLHKLVDSLMQVAEIDNGLLSLSVEPVSLPWLMRFVCEELRPVLQERKLHLRVERLDDLPVIQADPQALTKVFRRLLNNAVKYTPDGGTITVTGRTIEASEDSGGTESVEVVVADTGVGIDAANQELIFRKFYQTGPLTLHSSGERKFMGGGAGLGLAIVRGIVQALGGRVWVESPAHDEVNCPGSQFHVVLPADGHHSDAGHSPAGVAAAFSVPLTEGAPSG